MILLYFFNKRVQAKNDGQDKTHISRTTTSTTTTLSATTTTSRLLPTSSETRNAKRILNYVEKECEKSKSMTTVSRSSSGTSPTQTTCRSVNDFSKTSEGHFQVESVIPDCQEPHNSDDFTSANYNSTETRYRKRSSKSCVGLHAQKSLRSSEKDSTKMKEDYSERHKLKFRKTEGKNDQCSPKKPDLSVLDEIFF